MPVELPANPSLEHLKKEAKALFRDLRKNDARATARFAFLKLKGAPKLSDAQHVIAREYGFDNWSALRQHVESVVARTAEVERLALQAIRDDDAPGFRRLLEQYPILKTKINEPFAGFDSPLITRARSQAMLDVLLEAGADINARSQWWAGGFGLLDSADPALAAYAICRGAVVTIHSAARLGMLDQVKELVRADPSLVHAPGGDGQTPLHFASTIEIAEYLLDHAAQINARDVDHESTPAQYMLGERNEIAKYLVRRGCQTDILMASALGDLALVSELLRQDPERIRMRVSDEYFPMVSPRNGGTIYQWKLGWYVSACQVARSFGHQKIFDFLMEHSPMDEKLLNACWLHDEAMVASLLQQIPRLAQSLPPAGRRNLAHAARNHDIVAVRLMLLAGLPVNTFSQHHASALHWAAFHGDAEMVRMFLQHHADLDNAENDFKGTPLDWSIYGSENAWHPEKGDYSATVRVLLAAGATPPKELGGTQEVREVLRQYGVK